MDVRKSFPVEWQIKAAGDGTTRTFEGYASTWERDLGGDTIMPGAFTQTLADRLPKNLIKVRWMHGDPMGRMIAGHEDTKGLYVVGQASSTPTNEERFTLMQDGTVDRLSIGYSFDWESDDVLWSGNGRIINRLDLFEWSPVDLPMNEGTDVQITKAAIARLSELGITLPAYLVKAATTYKNLPLAARDRAWDRAGAEGRVRDWADANDAPNAQYRQAFFWYDSDNPDQFGSYKLAFCDVIDGTLTAIPRGIFMCAGVMQGARGGVDIPDADVAGVKSHIEKYYAKMADEFDDDTIVAPWNQDGKSGVIDGTKAGRVLSSKNRSIIEDAISALNQVLEADRAADDEGKRIDVDAEPPASGEEWKDARFNEIFDDISDTLSRLIVAG